MRTCTKECQQSVIYHPLMPKVNYLCMIKSHENMYERMPTERNLSSFDAKSELSTLQKVNQKFNRNMVTSVASYFPMNKWHHISKRSQ